MLCLPYEKKPICQRLWAQNHILRGPSSRWATNDNCCSSSPAFSMFTYPPLPTLFPYFLPSEIMCTLLLSKSGSFISTTEFVWTNQFIKIRQTICQKEAFRFVVRAIFPFGFLDQNAAIEGMLQGKCVLSSKKGNYRMRMFLFFFVLFCFFERDSP